MFQTIRFSPILKCQVLRIKTIGKDFPTVVKCMFIFRRQSFSGFITQFNLWDFALEEFQVENMATCRSDNWGNILQSKPENFEGSHHQTHVSISMLMDDNFV